MSSFTDGIFKTPPYNSFWQSQPKFYTKTFIKFDCQNFKCYLSLAFQVSINFVISNSKIFDVVNKKNKTWEAA